MVGLFAITLKNEWASEELTILVRLSAFIINFPHPLPSLAPGYLTEYNHHPSLRPSINNGTEIRRDSEAYPLWLLPPSSSLRSSEATDAHHSHHIILGGRAGGPGGRAGGGRGGC